jgi:hypothetical protein
MSGSSRLRSTHHQETELFLAHKAATRPADLPLSPHTQRLYRNLLNEFLTWQQNSASNPTNNPTLKEPPDVNCP